MRRPLAVSAALLVASFCLVASTAGAETKRPAKGEASQRGAVTRSRRVAVERFRGAGDVQAVRAAVVSALEEEVTLDVAPVRLLDKHKGINDGSPEGYSSIADRLDLLAVIHGKVGKGESGFLLALTVINGQTGKSLGTIAFSGASIKELKKNLDKELLTEIKPMLARAAGEASEPEPPPEEPKPEPPPEEPKPEPEKKAEPESPPEPEPEPEKDGMRCPWLELELGGGVLQRSFNYTEEERGALRGYRLKYAPFGSARATYRPFAHSACRRTSGLGLRLGYERAFGITSTVGGQALDTLSFAFESQVEFKVPVSIFAFTPRTGLVYRQFQVAGNLTPDPKYNLYALGLDGGLRIGVFLLELGWSARFVIDAGSLQSPDWFPNASGFGWQGEGRIGAAPTTWLDAFAFGEYESYSFDLKPNGSGAYPNGIARGSFDRYLRLGIGVRFNIPARVGAK